VKDLRNIFLVILLMRIFQTNFKESGNHRSFIGPHSDVPIAESRARYYCWLYHPDYGFYYGEGTKVIIGDYKGEYEGR